MDFSSVSNDIVLVGLGLLPSIVWLIYFYRRDCHPEPKHLIGKTFLMGIIISPIAILLQLGFTKVFTGPEFAMNTPGFFLWAAFIEETVKLLAIYLVILRNPEFNEPIDAMIYLITAALGFAALENILFLVKVFGDQGMLVGFITGNLRFLGATLLHVAASATVGASIAFSFFHKEKMTRNILGGLLLATALHTTFNFFIIRGRGANFFEILVPLWLAVVIILFICEKIKGLKQN